jgi:hypothetical protein
LASPSSNAARSALRLSIIACIVLCGPFHG